MTVQKIQSEGGDKHIVATTRLLIKHTPSAVVSVPSVVRLNIIITWSLYTYDGEFRRLI